MFNNAKWLFTTTVCSNINYILQFLTVTNRNSVCIEDAGIPTVGLMCVCLECDPHCGCHKL